MKKLPEKFDPTIFVGHAVEQVCVNANQLKFWFGNEVLLVVQNAVCLTQATGRGPFILGIILPVAICPSTTNSTSPGLAAYVTRSP